MSLFSHDRRKVLTFALLFTTLFLQLTIDLTLATNSIVINEFLPNPASGNDWVELYNPTSSSVDIGNWYLRDEANSHIADFSISTSIATGSHLAIDVGSRLNKDNDTVTLYNNVNETIDSRAYSQNPGDNISIGRYSDGSAWSNLQNPTNGSSNSSGNPVPTSTPTPTPTSSLTATTTLKPTNTPAPTSTPKPTTVPSATPTVKPSINLADSDSGGSSSDNGDLPEIDLAINDAMNPSPTNQPEVLGADSAKTSKPSLPLILIITGTILTLAGGLLLAYQEMKKNVA